MYILSKVNVGLGSKAVDGVSSITPHSGGVGCDNCSPLLGQPLALALGDDVTGLLTVECPASLRVSLLF